MTERFPARALRGLYAVTPEEPDTGRLLARAQAVLAGRPALLQYRNKGADAGLRREQAQALRDACRAAGEHGVREREQAAGVRLVGGDRVEPAQRVCREALSHRPRPCRAPRRNGRAAPAPCPRGKRGARPGG